MRYSISEIKIVLQALAGIMNMSWECPPSCIANTFQFRQWDIYIRLHTFTTSTGAGCCLWAVPWYATSCFTVPWYERSQGVGQISSLCSSASEFGSWFVRACWWWCHDVFWIFYQNVCSLNMLPTLHVWKAWHRGRQHLPDRHLVRKPRQRVHTSWNEWSSARWTLT